MPGFWMPVLAIVLEARGWDYLTDWVFVISPAGAIISPLFFGVLADQRMNAEKVLAALLFLSSLCLAASFWFLEKGSSPGWFLFFLCLKSLIGAPAWSLITSITLSQLAQPERQFGVVRVWGTVGWMVAGWVVSGLALDQSPITGLIAAGLGLVAAGASLALPPSPPEGKTGSSLVDRLGLRAFGVLKDRDTAVYFLTAFLFSVPLAAYYPYSAKYLKFLGVENVARFMSLGQVSEVVGMLLMGWVLRKMRVKWVFLLALTAGLLRYLLYAMTTWGEMPSAGLLVGMGVGVFMHGFCWTLFFESGRLFVDRRVVKSMRSQAQALLTVWSSGVATIVGVFLSGALYRWSLRPGGPGWSFFWLVLAALCGGATSVSYTHLTLPTKA